MEFLLISLGTTIGGIILYLITSAVVKAPGNVLAVKFAKLESNNKKIKNLTRR